MKVEIDESDQLRIAERWFIWLLRNRCVLYPVMRGKRLVFEIEADLGSSSTKRFSFRGIADQFNYESVSDEVRAAFIRLGKKQAKWR